MLSETAQSLLHSGRKGLIKAGQALNHATKPLRKAVNPSAVIVPDYRAIAPVSTILHSLSVNLAELDPGAHLGVSTPGAVTQLGIAEALAGNQRAQRERATAIRDLDGSLDMLYRGDHIQLTGGKTIRSMTDLTHIPIQFARNLINNVPTTSQQAGLNLAVLAHYAKHQSDDFAKTAQFLSHGVGKEWNSLIDVSVTSPGFSTANSAAGLTHLFEDVPRYCKLYLLQLPQQLRKDKKAWLEWIKKLGGAAEIAKMAAVGALPGTQELIQLLKKEVPTYYGTVMATGPAMLFFTEAVLEASVEVRDDCMVEAAREVISPYVDIDTRSIKEAMASGASEARGAATEVAQIAYEVSKTLAHKNFEAALMEASS